MKRGYCEICSDRSVKLWTLVLAQYDSLKVEQSVRVDLCEVCAGKMSKALEVITAKYAEEEAVIICPACKGRVPAGDPKTARPCPRCSTIFSGYSAWKDGQDDQLPEANSSIVR